MRPRFLSAAAFAAWSLIVMASCGKKPEAEKPGPGPEVVDPVKTVEVNLTAGSTEFDENGEASLSLALSEASDKEVTVKIAVSPDVQSGFTAVDAAKIVIDDSTVAIPAGSKSASVKVAVKLDEVEDGQQAAFTISSVTGAEVGKDATVYLKVNKPAPPAPLPSNLDWTVRYVGCDWLEEDLDAGQQEFFEVITSDKLQLYFYFVYDMGVESEKATIDYLKSDPQSFIQAFQAQVDEEIDGVLEEYSYWFGSREEVVSYLAYCEMKDGTILSYDGQKAGDYVFLVLTLSAQGVLDGGYSYIEFSKDTDAEAHYDYGIQATLQEDWTIECLGRENSPYYTVVLKGMAPGASNVFLIPYESEESMIEQYGGVGNAIGSELNYIQLNVDAGVIEYEDYMSSYSYPVAEDGSFQTSTWGTPDETTFYLILGLDEDYNVLPGYPYGQGVVVYPSRDSEPFDPGDPEHLDDSEWTDRTDWDIYFDPEAETGSEYYTQAVVVTACDADYFTIHIGEAGEMERLGIARIGLDEFERIQRYFNYFTLEKMLEFGFLYSSAYLPCIEEAQGLVDGVELTIIGFDSDFNLTKEYHTDTVVDAGPAAVAPARRSRDARPCPKIDKPVIIR